MKKHLFALLSTTLLVSIQACTAADVVRTAGDLLNGDKPSAAPTSSAAPAANPAAVEAFRARFAQQATTPRGAARMLFEALLDGLSDSANAENYLTLVLRNDELSATDSSPTGYGLTPTGQFMLQQLQNRPEIIYSYIGATPDKNYTNWNRAALQLNVPAQGETVGQIVVDNSAEKDGATTGRLYVVSSGKDTPTPINLDRNNQGLWKIQIGSVGNLATGVKPGTADSGNF